MLKSYLVFLLFFLNINYEAYTQLTGKAPIENLRLEADKQFNQKAYKKALTVYLHTYNLSLQNKDWNTLIYCCNKIASCYQNLEDGERGLEYWTKAVNYSKKYLKETDPQYAQAFKEKGDAFISLQNIDSSIYYLNKAYHLYYKIKNTEQYAFCKIGLGVCFYYKRKFLQMEQNLLEAKKIVSKKLPPNHEIYGTLSHLFSVVYQETGNFDEALNNAFDALNLKLKSKESDSVEIANDLNIIGILYDDKGDFENAINYYLKACSIYQAMDKEHINLIDLYNNIGIYFYNQEDFDQAHSYFQRALFISRLHPKALLQDKIIVTYNFLAKSYLRQMKPDSAYYFLKKGVQTDEKLRIQYDRTLENLGKYYIAKKDYENALKCYRKALPEILKKYGNRHFKVSFLYYDIAELFFLKGDYQKALIYCDSSINLNSPVIGARSISAISNLSLLKVLHLKAKTLALLPGEHKGDTREKSILKIYRLLARLIDNMRVEYNAEGSKLHLAKVATPIYESAVDFCVSQYQRTKKVKFFEEALYFAEKNKAIVLLDAVRESNIRNMTILPSKLVQLEKTLVLDKNFYTGKVISERKKDFSDSLKLSVWENKLFFLNKSHDSLIRVFEQKYPQYYQLKYETRVAGLKTIRAQLLKDPNTALVEYFVGEKNTYLFGVTQDQVFLKSISEIGELQQLIKNFRNSLDFQSTRSNLDNAYFQYTVNAQKIYDLLLKPFMEGPARAVEKLIVIPSDIIGYIPFEALLKAPPASPNVDYGIKNLHYLIKDCTISYGYSAYFLSINSQQSKERKDLETEPYAGFAPAFSSHSYMSMRSCDNELLSTLHCNKTEVEEIAKILNGTSYTQDKSTKASFLKEASRYQILHLATHACLDNENSLMNKIYFSDGFISAYELSSHPLQAEMIVLSACNTGIGTLAKGEGFLSLSRSFAQAGCPSIVMSLWSVDDCATSEVMKHFYENIKKGLPKDEALSKAKLTYLSGKDNLYSNPFFWAGFVHIGDASPVSSDKNKNLLRYVLSGAGLLLILLLFFAYKRKGITLLL